MVTSMRKNSRVLVPDINIRWELLTCYNKKGQPILLKSFCTPFFHSTQYRIVMLFSNFS